MRRILRWTGWTLAVVFAIVLIATAAIYLLSERLLDATNVVPQISIEVPTDAASIVEGQRLATVHGCYLACHGTEARGDEMVNIPLVARINSPNLSQIAKRFSNAQLAAVIRDGVDPDGHGLMVMPAQTFHDLTDQDLGRIIAFIRTLPLTTGPGSMVHLGPLGRLGLVQGKFSTAPKLVAELKPLPAARANAGQLGRYLAQTICTECHGSALEGASNPDFTSPDLHLVSAYSEADFNRLMRSGIAAGDRKVGLMTDIAQLDLSHLTDAEVASLYSYLHELGPIGSPAGS